MMSVIDWPETLRQGSSQSCSVIQLDLRKRTPQDTAFEIKEELGTILHTQEIKAKHKWMTEAEEIYVSVQSHPRRRPYIKLGNQARSYLVKRGVMKKNIRLEYGPPVRVYRCDSEGNSLALDLFKWTKATKHWTSWIAHIGIRWVAERSRTMRSLLWSKCQMNDRGRPWVPPRVSLWRPSIVLARAYEIGLCGSYRLRPRAR